MKEKNNTEFAFKNENYILLIIGLILIGVGIFLLIAPPEDPNELWSEDKVKMFDKQRWVIAPIFIAAGYIVEVFAIMYKAKEE